MRAILVADSLREVRCILNYGQAGIKCSEPSSRNDALFLLLIALSLSLSLSRIGVSVKRPVCPGALLFACLACDPDTPLILGRILTTNPSPKYQHNTNTANKSRTSQERRMTGRHCWSCTTPATAARGSGGMGGAGPDGGSSRRC